MDFSVAMDSSENGTKDRQPSRVHGHLRAIGQMNRLTLKGKFSIGLVAVLVVGVMLMIGVWMLTKLLRVKDMVSAQSGEFITSALAVQVKEDVAIVCGDSTRHAGATARRSGCCSMHG